MKATFNGILYDTDEAENICNATSRDGDDFLYQTSEGRFFLVKQSTYLDGVKLRPSESPEDVAPELDSGSDDLEDAGESWASIYSERRRRIRVTRTIVPLSDREALVWCIKTQLPDAFRGRVLESI